MSSSDRPEGTGDGHAPASSPAPQEPQPTAPASSSVPIETNDTQIDNVASDAVKSEPQTSGESAAPAPAIPSSHPNVAEAASAPATNETPIESEEQKSVAPAIEASSELDNTPVKEVEEEDEEEDDSGPALTITLLLITGARHPFKIDGKYLRKRSINVDNHDPFEMSVYTLKELIWREWRPDWEPRPSSPSSIRLISFGKLLDDKAPLSDSRFSRDAPNVVHMTVKPQEVVDEEDAKGGKTQYGRERDPSERSPGCRCIIL